ncbi:MAG TPA: DegV family protein [Steroidobacteraceae bacterium]|nr:DegV family protein [Steroidobacteraceae bacterium]
MNAVSVPADSLDGLRLNFALQAGILRLLSRQEHLNKINVFPVPDGDTGTNLALTVHAVLGSLRKWPDQHAGKTLTRVADAALDGARGNSGAILAQFFLGLCDRLGHLQRLDPDDLAEGVGGGADYARESMSDPREGTILTVLTDFAHAVQRARREGLADFRSLLRRGVVAAQTSLEQTRFQLEALRKANVVDAGAQGFVELIAGLSDYLESGADAAPPGAAEAVVVDSSAERTAGAEEDLADRYCTECVVVGERVERRHLREQLSAIGGSIVVAGLQHKVRVHIHVNDPAEVFRIAARFGEVAGEKVDDMQRQQHSAHAGGRRVVVVVDSAADIPEDEMDRLGIHMVPVRVHFGDRSYLDKLGITPEEFYAEIVRGGAPPKTSQPPPGDFRRQFEFLGSHFEAVVSINLTSRASGTHRAAETAAARTTTHGSVTVIDSRNASTGQGLLAMYAAECAAAGHDSATVIAATRAMIPRTRTFGMVGSLEYAVRGGRVPRWVKRVADALRLTPVLHADRQGRVSTGGVLFGRRDMTARFARFVRRRMRDDCVYRVLVGHANCETEGQRLLEMLRAPNVAYSRLVPLGSALGAHGGPGMLVVAFQPYEAAPPAEVQ